MRGEQVPAIFHSSSGQGPSPRARGAVPPPLPARPPRGTIPACAGSSRPRPDRRLRTRDHPRVRGEQVFGPGSPGFAVGPSPRARGAAAGTLRIHCQEGTIPACAGSSPGRQGRSAHAGDHPRVRGEQDGCRHRFYRACGTIPACAGSSPATTIHRRCSWDHPRMRGEQVVASAGAVRLRGPSPRARGADEGAWAGVAGVGTIPACAGSRRRPGRRRRSRRDHPRVRGEQPAFVDWLNDRPGPSPRARGAVGLRGRGKTNLGPSPRARGAGESSYAQCV